MRRTCIIIDDEKDARELIAHHLLRHPHIEVLATCSNADEGLKAIALHHPDLIFLDIQMPGKSGFDLLSELRALNISIPITVFCTAHDKYAIQAIKFAAFDYLLKPVMEDEFDKTILRAMDVEHHTNGKFERYLDYVHPENKLRINTRTGYLLINVNEIIYCQADGNYTELYTDKNRKEVATMNLGHTYQLLQAHPQFQRIGRSCIINRNYLYAVDRAKKEIVLQKNGTDIRLQVPDGYLSALG
jgi:two-component system LytT family response regulator